VRAAREEGVEAAFHGGYEVRNAELRVLRGKAPETWPIECLRAEWNAAYARVQHRDILGAALALASSGRCWATSWRAMDARIFS
jgi:hypothetical protein